MNTVTPTTAIPQMNAVDLGDLATDLRDIANAVYQVGTSLAADDTSLPRVTLTLFVQPSSAADEADRVRVIDAFATAVLGKPGQPVQMTSGTWHHHADGAVGRVQVRIFARVDDGERRAMREHIDALQAEVEQLRKDGAR